MPEQDPYLHLTLVEVVAHSSEIVIQDLLEVVRLDVLQLHECLLELLFRLVVSQHGALLSFENVSQEGSLELDHVLDFVTLDLPVVNVIWEGAQLLHQSFTGTRGNEEISHCLGCSLGDSALSHDVFEHEAATKLVLLTDLESAAILENVVLVVGLQAHDTHQLFCILRLASL